MHKICTKCKVSKNFSLFSKKVSRKDGLQSWCKECSKEAITKANSTGKYEESKKKARKKWVENNKGFQQACVKASQTKRMLRQPSWLTEDDKWMIREAYELAILREKATGVKHHVDHIVPLQGLNVSGLHVPWNLQVIPALENLRKNNKHD